MNKVFCPVLRRVFGAVIAGLWCCAQSRAQINERENPPQLGVGIVASLQSGQDIYTNYSPVVWCPPCVTNRPPCMVACYEIETTAIARFNFEVGNEYALPRTFEFPSGQRCELELRDQSGNVVVAWSDGKFFTQEQTSLTIEPGGTKTFALEIPLKDRQSKQLNGTYLAQACLLTAATTPQERPTAATQIIVTLAP